MEDFKLVGSSNAPSFFLERDGMEEFKLYSVSDEYIEYLRAIFPNVYSNKETTRVHTRKYVGIVLRL